MHIHQVLPGVKAAFYEYRSPHCHAFNDMAIARDIVGDVLLPRRMLEVNVCREGTFRVLSAERRVFTTLRQGDVSLAVTEVSERARTPVGSAAADWMLDLPTSRYRGFGLIVDVALAEERAGGFLAALGFGLGPLLDAYRLGEREFIMEADLGIERAVDGAEAHRACGEEPLLRLAALEVLARLAARAATARRLARPECSLETARLVREARNCAVAHLERRYTIDELSRRFGMSPTVFKAAFREVYGKPYARSLARVRMERAEALLAQGEPVQRVAQAVGYESPGKFSAAFKRAFGKPPSAYREAVARAGGA